MSASDELNRLKELYLPPADEFVLVDVPDMEFVMLDGEGRHSTEGCPWALILVGPSS